jgi:hypothetical protein
MTSFKPVFIFQNGNERSSNNQRFGSYEEAEQSAHARFMVWTMPESYDVEETHERTNYIRVNGIDKPI